MLQFRVCVIFILATGMVRASQDWNMNEEPSRVYFESTKVITEQHSITERHHFRGLSGTVDNTGQFRFTIPVTQLSTGIALRDQRILNWLLQPDQYPWIGIEGKLSPENLRLLNAGERAKLTQSFQVTLKEQSLALTGEFLMDKATRGITIRNVSELTIDVNNLPSGAEAIKKMVTVMGLKGIVTRVPVEVELSLSRD